MQTVFLKKVKFLQISSILSSNRRLKNLFHLRMFINIYPFFQQCKLFVVKKVFFLF